MTKVSYLWNMATAAFPHFCVNTYAHARTQNGLPEVKLYLRAALPCRPPHGGLATDAVSPPHPPHLVPLPGHVLCRPAADGQAPPPGAQTSHDIVQHFTSYPVTVHVPRGRSRCAQRGFSVLQTIKNINMYMSFIRHRV